MSPLYQVDPSIPLIRGNAEHHRELPPRKMQEMMNAAVSGYGDKPAMRVKRNDVTYTWTFKEYEADVKKVARSLIHLGVKAHEVTLIMGFNAPEWALALVGSIYAGGAGAGVYATNTIPAVQYQVEHSRAAVAFVEDEKQAAKFLDIRKRDVGNLKYIVQWGGTKPDEENVFTWEEFLALGAELGDDELKARDEATTPGHACSLIYTSGTTGPPKAVMISHDNITFVSRKMVPLIDGQYGQERIMGYLPLSHIAGQILDIHMMIEVAGLCYYAPPSVMKAMVPVLQEVQPTIFFGVPRVWEKIEEKLSESLNEAVGLKRSLVDWARQVGTWSTDAYQNKTAYPWGFYLAQMLIFNPIRAKLGLSQTKRFLTGAAPIKKSTTDFFATLNIPVLEIFGMSECTGPATFNHPEKCRIGTSGPELSDPSCHLKIDKPDEFGEGEVCWKGRHIMLGYMFNEEESKKAIDEDGYLHSGDIGVLRDGFLSITGRKKELIVTAGGENVPPVLIENEIKKELDAVSNAMVVGDKQKYLVVLLTLKNKPCPTTGGPTDDLDSAALRVPGSDAKTLDEAAACPVFNAYIKAGIDRANERATSNAQRVQYFRFIPEFSIPGGELTPTLKLMRKKAADKHAAKIEEMYQ